MEPDLTGFLIPDFKGFLSGLLSVIGCILRSPVVCQARALLREHSSPNATV